MIREIKFKGKTIQGNITVVGHLIYWAENYQIWQTDSEGQTHNYLVDKNTIGEFTGLKDKNNVDIYEGNIFEYKKHKGYLLDDFQGKILFEDGSFGYEVINGQSYKKFTPFAEHDEIQSDFLDHLTVIS